ncbi:Pseudouridine synthase [Sulfidibacter corallicola]|uniref:Pseudouridine synthase n=1 Tax=Sulfidibacter corallicola TaxID=2818388 RepID=A0A8A4TUR1_SULCO|nr:RluA family pseudouridine synthase [Sulfidibacter corallicola]QTD52762.1 RluA family pseudouridine synthase [Sulfidibacter corallicola]
MNAEEYFLVPELEHPERLDSYLTDMLEEVSRTKVKSWCKEGLVTVDGKVRKSSFQLHGGEELSLSVPDETPPETVTPENIPLEILYEDEAIILVNKAAGMVVHPGAGIYSGTLVNALAYHFEHLATRGGDMRPGIVHRLDKGTTGLILVAKNDRAHQKLQQQWQNHEVTKVYQTLVWGIPEPAAGEIETHMGRHPRLRYMMAADVANGRYAKTRYKVAEPFGEAAKVNVHILTGRTHQVRVHLAHVGHPVVGDALYGRNRHRNLAKQFEAMPDYPMLHAAMLRFAHPVDGREMTFKQAPPPAFEACAAALAKWPY